MEYTTGFNSGVCVNPRRFLRLHRHCKPTSTMDQVWSSNSDPNLIGRWYLEGLLLNGVVPNYIRLDRGTETGAMAAIKGYLGDCSGSVIFGRSTCNQVRQIFITMQELIYT